MSPRSSLQRFAYSRWYQSALLAALVAMLLLMIGPLISQFQAGSHAHHDGRHGHQPSVAAQLEHSGHDHGSHHAPPLSDSAVSHDHQGQQASPAPIFTWFHECGYCSIWQQFPSAHAFLPAIARHAFLHHTPLPQSPQQGFASLVNYYHAPTRAPPAPLATLSL